VPRWYATLAAQGDSAGAERGSAVVQPGAPLPGRPTTELLAFVSVRRLPPGATLRWRVQQGSCGTPGTVVGSAAAYPTMRVQADGMTGAQATLTAAAPAEGAHSVWVADSTERVLACGELRLMR
jgi:hypothetical protein